MVIVIISANSELLKLWRDAETLVFKTERFFRSAFFPKGNNHFKTKSLTCPPRLPQQRVKSFTQFGVEACASPSGSLPAPGCPAEVGPRRSPVVLDSGSLRRGTGTGSVPAIPAWALRLRPAPRLPAARPDRGLSAASLRWRARGLPPPPPPARAAQRSAAQLRTADAARLPCSAAPAVTPERRPLRTARPPVGPSLALRDAPSPRAQPLCRRAAGDRGGRWPRRARVAPDAAGQADRLPAARGPMPEAAGRRRRRRRRGHHPEQCAQEAQLHLADRAPAALHAGAG